MAKHTTPETIIENSKSLNIDFMEKGLDIEILKDGSIVMYHSTQLLEKDIQWFDQNNYQIIDIDTSYWSTENIHEKIKRDFDFPDYYGENWDAFRDCLSDFYNKKYKGLLIVFRSYDKITEEDKELSEYLLGIISNLSRDWLVSNQFLIGVVHSNDPNLFFNKVGGEQPFWNSREWFDEDRRNKKYG